MPFVPAKIEIKPASVGTGIKCLLRKTVRNSAMLSFSINAAVARQINVGDGDKVEVMLGDGDHHGLLRLRKNNSVGIAPAAGRTTGKGAFFLIKLGHQPAFVDRSEPSAWCQWEMVEDGWVEIVLPKWADETAPNHKTASEVSRLPRNASANVPHMPLRKQNVTADLMGDPPPGRRQMLEQIGKIKA